MRARSDISSDISSDDATCHLPLTSSTCHLPKSPSSPCPYTLLPALLPWPVLWPDVNTDFDATHAIAEVDLVTIHVWPQNWGWGDASSPWSYEQALSKSMAYVEQHARKVSSAGKPLIIEEFGLARDGQAHASSGEAKRREAFYEAMVHKAADLGISGIMPWAWAGEGRPRSPGGYWQAGDDNIGDPPHEPQGWYSVYNSDVSTLQLLGRLTKEEFYGGDGLGGGEEDERRGTM